MRLPSVANKKSMWSKQKRTCPVTLIIWLHFLTRVYRDKKVPHGSKKNPLAWSTEKAET